MERRSRAAPVVSYRVYFDGELHSEVAHTSQPGAQPTAIKEDITPGVILRTQIRTVNSLGITSAPAETEGKAPIDERLD